MTTKATWAKRCLTAIGIVFVVMGVLQAALAFGDAAWIRFLGAPRWAVDVFNQGGATLVLMAALAIGCSVAIACYCLSGGGLIRALPGRRPALIGLGIVLFVWGLRVFQLIAIQLSGAGSVRWQIFIIRGAPLLIGLVLLWSVFVLGKDLNGVHRDSA